jgi:hypothetical protein
MLQGYRPANENADMQKNLKLFDIFLISGTNRRLFDLEGWIEDLH